MKSAPQGRQRAFEETKGRSRGPRGRDSCPRTTSEAVFAGEGEEGEGEGEKCVGEDEAAVDPG